MQRVGSLCPHQRIKRVDKDFVACIDCKQSWVKPVGLKGTENLNKRPEAFLEEFTKDNKSFEKNFKRNFDNEFESKVDWHEKYIQPIETKKQLERTLKPFVYLANDGRTVITISKQSHTDFGTETYPIFINGQYYSHADTAGVKEFLHSQGAIRIQ